MSLSKKSSRSLTVGNNQYRWAVSEDSGYSVLVVQNATGKGQKLEVSMPWASQGGDPLVGPTPIKPNLVSKIIIAAEDQGWDAKLMTSSAFRRLYDTQSQTLKSIT